MQPCKSQKEGGEEMAEEQKEAKQEVTEQKTAEQTTGQPEQTNPEKQEYREITIKFGKGCCKDPFTAKDGKSYMEICIPNTDPEDHTPWASFVLPRNHVHENQYGKGLWAKLPENGHTGIQKPVCRGQDENGKNIWENQKSVVPNAELKAMVEAYKNKTRGSVTEKLSKDQESAADRPLKLYPPHQKEELPFR